MNLPRCPKCGHDTLKHETGNIYRCGYCGDPFLIRDERSHAEKMTAARRDLATLKRNAPHPTHRSTQRCVRPYPPKTAQLPHGMECWMFADSDAIVRETPRSVRCRKW